jgi:formimidoylglutamase
MSSEDRTDRRASALVRGIDGNRTSEPSATASSLGALLMAPDPSLFHEGHDSNDPKLGESVARRVDAIGEARIAIVGCPQDLGVRRNAGRPGAASAPREIRRRLYRLSTPIAASGGAVVDVGDVRIADSLEETHERQQRVVEGLLDLGLRVVVLGGGNDISLPDVSALAAACSGEVLAFNVDSHFDVRESARSHSGTPYRELLDNGTLAPDRLYQMGHTPGANSPVYVRYLEQCGVPFLSLDQIRRLGTEEAFRSILRKRDAEAVFWGFDMDAVRSADAPGVSAGYPVGFTAEEICRIAREAGLEPRTRVIEITECNPEQDVDDRTSMLAAMMVVSFLEALPGP